MADQKRIEALKTYCEQWKESLNSAAANRDHLLSLQSEGVSIFENGGSNLLPTLISEADAAVLQLQKILIKMESLRDRAVAGEDV
jgi:hypothetical protein